MKKIFLFGLIATGALLMNSCSVTDLQPQDAIPTTSVYSDSTNIDLAVSGVYHSAQSQLYGYNAGGDPRGYPFGAAHIEQAEMRGEDLVNTQGFFTIVYINTQTPTSPNIVNLWGALFEVVNQANTVIEGLKTTKAISAGRVAQLTGEMRFLRAMAYHDLLIFFCRPYNDNPTQAGRGVPWRDTPTQDNITQANTVDRGTVANVYTNLLADLDFAESNLPAAVSTVTHATKGAAIALKSRVYLHMGDWANVIKESAKLVSNTASPKSPIGNFVMNAAPEGAFKNFESAESIFSIGYSSVNQGSPNGGLGSAFLPSDKGGRGLIGVSPNLYNASFWTANDLRRSQYITQSSDNGTYYIYKYKDPSTNTDYSPVIRYPEVLLNYAEALARSGGSAIDAVNLLNAVRNRAVDAGHRYTGSSFSTPDDIVQAVLNERRIEFIGEGRRYPDIHRLANDAKFAPIAGGGIPAKVAFAQYSDTDYVAASGNTLTGTAAKALPYTDHRFIYPISYLEIGNNPALANEQNDGY